MQVFRIKGSFTSLDEKVSALFELGARGLEEKSAEVWAYFPERLELALPGEWQELPDTDWLEAWKRDLQPVKAGPFVVLAPWHSWDGDELRIQLEPGMAFGTGHHQTTRMALGELAQQVKPGMRVLDLGTGSGILAIGAEMLGAEAVGLDIDAAVIPQAEDNARANGVSASFWVGGLDSLPGLSGAAQGPFDLLVANLYAELHLELAQEYTRILGICGTAILTGILVERGGLVKEAMLLAGFTLISERRDGDWLLQAYSKR